MDGAVLVSFGPFWDTMFKIFIVLGIFAFAGITFQYLEVEIRSWFGKKEDLAVEFDDMYPKVVKEPRDPENDGRVFDFDTQRNAVALAPQATFNIKDDGTVINNMTGEKLEPDSTNVVHLDAVSPYPDAYLVQWGELENFSRVGETDIVRTYEPHQEAVNLVNNHGAGYLRWRLAGNDAVTPEWVHLSYYSPEYIGDIYNLEPPKEKINGQA